MVCSIFQNLLFLRLVYEYHEGVVWKRCLKFEVQFKPIPPGLLSFAATHAEQRSSCPGTSARADPSPFHSASMCLQSEKDKPFLGLSSSGKPRSCPKPWPNAVQELRTQTATKSPPSIAVTPPFSASLIHYQHCMKCGLWNQRYKRRT